MKKVLSFIMSLFILLSVAAGIDFSACADTAQSNSFYTVEDAADFLREGMINRESEIVVNIQTAESDYSKLVKDIYNTAIDPKASDRSDAGDYLLYTFAGYNAAISGIIGSYYDITYNVSYNTTAEQEQAVTAEIEKIIQDYKLEQKSDYAKIKTIHDLICDRVTYDYDNLQNPDYKLQYTAYAALFDGKSVCQGYTLLFYRLAKEVNLDVRIIRGTASGGGHAWNIVKLGDKYYEVDCTWDDAIYDTPNAVGSPYDYFMKGTSDFADHVRADEYATAEFYTEYPMAEGQYVCPHSERKWVVEEGASCLDGFVKTQICTNCEEVFDTVTVKPGPHSYNAVVVAPTKNEQGYTEYTCSVCGYSYVDSITDYASDNSTLLAVLGMISDYAQEDYSAESYANLQTVYNQYVSFADKSLPQTEIDSAVYDILTAISDLVPYLNLSVSGSNGTVSVSYDTVSAGAGKYSVLFGTEITLTATANDGYVFDGWYETVTKTIFSTEETYTFIITSNTSFRPLFVRENSATLTFANDTVQIQSMINKTVDQWKRVTTIADLLPQVPYKLGYTNGRWVYDEAEVLAKLRNGEDVTIRPEYDVSDYEYPAVPVPEDNKPALNLYYSLDSEKDIGSFTMALGIPDGCRVESIGIAFYYKNAQNFNPSAFELTINNKMLTGKFDAVDSNGIYIVDMHKFTAQYNWAVRGYVTYYDENGDLKIAYTNQINIVNREQIK